VGAHSRRAEQEKLAAAQAAARLIEPRMTVGLGSGTTVNRLIDVLGQSPPDALFVAASPATASAAQAHALRVVTLDQSGTLDLAIDGADQIDPAGWLIKGGGAAHTREKIVAAAARRFVVIASSDKLVERLQPPLPIELVAFAPETTMSAIGPTRRREHTPPSPDRGVIADFLGPIDDPRELARRLDQQPGLIGHGLFPPEMVDVVIVGIGGDNVDVRRPANSRDGSSHPDSGNVGRLGCIFGASLNAFAADPTIANFGRYRVASVALDAVREAAASAVEASNRRESTTASG
jgi:ribose 5-phosphate isomerase A